jgi:hypothetical protein
MLSFKFSTCIYFIPVVLVFGKCPEVFRTKSQRCESFPKSSGRNRSVAKASQSLPAEIASLRKLPEVFQPKSQHCESFPKSSGRNRSVAKASQSLPTEIASLRKLLPCHAELVSASPDCD